MILVSGAPRSGTSMMMRILDFGGIPPVYGINPEPKFARESHRNYYGFYEGNITEYKDDKSAKSFALKRDLKNSKNPKIIFMLRDPDQVLKSRLAIREFRKSKNMRVNKPSQFDSTRIAETQKQIMDIIKDYDHLIIPYDDFHANPKKYLKKIKKLVAPIPFDEKKAFEAIDRSLFIIR
jgi:hypothetical protein